VTDGGEKKRLNVFERYLSVWVALCMVAGVALGKLLPGFTDAVRSLEFGEGSQINVAIAVLIWLMVYPMMLKIDFGSIVAVRERPRGILVTLFVNWLVKPFSMAAIGYLFFRVLFQPWIGAELANQYLAGSIILAAAPCTAMVFVWSYLTDGDPAYTLVQVSLNDLIMLVLFAPIVGFLVTGASTLTVPFNVLLLSVVVFIVIPLALGAASRVLLLRAKGREWFEGRFLPAFHPVTVVALLATLVMIFAFQADNLTGRFFHVVLIADPGLLQLRSRLRPHEMAEGSARRRGAGSPDRRQQLLRARRRHRDRALRPRVGRGARHGRRCAGRSPGDALGLFLLQPHPALVPRVLAEIRLNLPRILGWGPSDRSACAPSSSLFTPPRISKSQPSPWLRADQRQPPSSPESRRPDARHSSLEAPFLFP